MAAPKKVPAAKAAKKKAKTKPRTTRAPSKAIKPSTNGVAEPKLSEELQVFVVSELASFRTPSEAAEALKAEHGIEITRQSVQRYDPRTFAGRGLSEKLKALFYETRKRWLDETSNIAIAGRAERLRRLERLADKAEGMNNIMMARELVKQAAEEMGDVYTNKRTLDGKLGVESAVTFKPDLSGLSKAELDALGKLSSALAGKPPSAR